MGVDPTICLETSHPEFQNRRTLSSRRSSPALANESQIHRRARAWSKIDQKQRR